MAFIQKDVINKLLDIFLNAKDLNDIDYEYNQIIANRNAELQSWLVNVTYFANQLRLQNITDLNVINLCVLDILFKHVKEYLARNSTQTILNEVDIQKFELFIDCFSLYLLDFVRKPNKKFDKNDYIDFMNLLYCTNEFKYLTLESEKKNRLGKMLELSQYSNKYLLPDNKSIKDKLNLDD